MPEPIAVYRRKLTRDDVKTGSLLIEKSRWHLFPAPGVAIRVEAGDRAFETAIWAEDCACIPPPHQHYHLPVEALAGVLKPGATLVFERLDERTYRLVQPETSCG